MAGKLSETDYDAENKREAYEERAAIMEYDACMTREQAETMAARLVYGQSGKPTVAPSVGGPRC